MLTLKNLPKLLGDRFDPRIEYAMIECNASGRAGRFPSPRKGNGYWQSMGEFSDPEVDSKRRFTIFRWLPDVPIPKVAGLGHIPAQKEPSS